MILTTTALASLLLAPAGHDFQDERAARATAEPAPGVAERSFGLAAADAGPGLVAGGPRYRAEFGPEGLVLTPAFGAAVAASRPLAFELAGARLGEQVLLEAAAAAPERDGLTVVYRRGTVDERYEVRREGVAQSFVFHELPDGTGDLVVRGRLESSLAWRRAEGGLAFELPGVGALEYGGVTGIDAAGRTAPGSLAYDGEWLELRLPGDFVAEAALPLVLDPLIGNVEVVADAFDDGAPDVAYDATNDTYLVVYERRFSASDVDVRGQRVDGTGQLVGGSIFLESSGAVTALNPSVAGCNATDAFFVAWQEGPSFLGPWDVRGRSVAAATGITQPAMSVAADVGVDEVEPAVGGEATTADDDVLVAWRRVGQGLRARQVTVPVASTPFLVGSTAVLDTGDDVDDHAITKSGGADGRCLVVWKRFYTTPAPGDHDLVGMVLDRNANTLTGALLLDSLVGPDERAPAVDGDGVFFYVAYERAPALGSGDSDVRLLKTKYAAGSLATVESVVVEGDPGEAEVQPAVADLGGKVFVAWSDEFSFLDYDLLVQGLEPQGCKVCGVQSAAALGPRRYGWPAMASARSGDPAAEHEGLLVWEGADLTPPFASDVFAQRVAAFGAGGAVTNQGGGCGEGGDIGSEGPFAVGNSTFQVTVENADLGASTAILAFNPVETVLPCGPCEWLVWGGANLLFLAPLSGGSGSAVVPVPCGLVGAVGVPVHCQWMVLDASSTPCSLFQNVGLSDRLRLVIGT